MSNQDRLLSDEELREEFADIMADYDRARKSPSGDSVDIEVNTSNRLTKLFNTQKRLYAESVEEELLDMAYDTIISYGYMRDDDKYMSGGFSTQELAFSHMRKIGAIDSKGLFDPQAYMKYCNELRAEQRARIK